MASSLYEVLQYDVRKMVRGLGEREQGNIYPLLVGQMEKYLIEIVLEETGYNYLQAARSLGISRSTLYRKLETLHIQRKEPLGL